MKRWNELTKSTLIWAKSSRVALISAGLYHTSNPKVMTMFKSLSKGFQRSFFGTTLPGDTWNREKIPSGKIISHRCSNPGCGKYKHLRCVSKQINEEMKDCFYVREAITKKLLLICKHTPVCKPPLRVRSITHNVKSKITLAFQD